MKLHEFHLHEQLVSWDLAAPLLCSDCNTRIIAEANNDALDITSFWCPGCGYSFRPGLNTLNRLHGELDEFNRARPN